MNTIDVDNFITYSDSAGFCDLGSPSSACYNEPQKPSLLYNTVKTLGNPEDITFEDNFGISYTSPATMADSADDLSKYLNSSYIPQSPPLSLFSGNSQTAHNFNLFLPQPAFWGFSPPELAMEAVDAPNQNGMLSLSKAIKKVSKSDENGKNVKSSTLEVSATEQQPKRKPKTKMGPLERTLRNRMSAQQSRNKRAVHIQELKDMHAKVASENKKLALEKEQLNQQLEQAIKQYEALNMKFQSLNQPSKK